MGLVPMRAEPGHGEELVSQLLFGEHYEVMSNKRKWYLIKLASDRSMGWIHMNHHTTISDEYYQQIGLCDYKICTDISGTIYFQKKHVHILMGSILPIASNELFRMEEQVAFTGESKPLSQKKNADHVISIAELFRHAPYLPGGRTVFGVDQGGFLQQVFKQSGYQISRTLSEIAIDGQAVSVEEIKIADIVLAGEKKNQVGLLYMGGKQYLGVIEGQVRKIENPTFNQSAMIVRRMLREV